MSQFTVDEKCPECNIKVIHMALGKYKCKKCGKLYEYEELIK